MSEPQGPPPGYAPPAQQGYPPPGQPGYPPPGQPGYPPPGQPGYPPPVQQGYAPQYGPPPTNTSSVVVVSQPGVPGVLPGGCRACGGGVIEDSFTVCGICLAIWFFPLGILCCFLLMEKKCANCGARFG